MNTAPIILFVYNRPWHTRQTLEALAQNDLAARSTLYIYADGPKKNADKNTLQQIADTRACIKSAQWCKQVIINERENNLGLANSIINGVTEIINRHERVIVLEDDIVTSTAFLKFMNDGLNFYMNETKVACITGYIYPIRSLPKTFFLKGSDCWGWATWRRAWDKFEKDGENLLNQLQERKEIHDFNFYDSYSYDKMLEDYIEGKNDSWAVRWYASVFLNRQYCLYPGKSFVKNIGLDGTGVHSVAVDTKNELKLNSGIDIKYQNIEENKLVKQKIAEYLKKSEPHSIKLLRKLKRVVQKIKRSFQTGFGQEKQNYSPIFGWSGNYSNWLEAQAECTGYNNDNILEKCKSALLKVKNGEAVYERDSVLFDKIQYTWPLLAGLLRVALENRGKLSVIDFGGSLGSSYFQNRSFLNSIKEFSWSIVEQEIFVKCGKENFEDDHLKFFYSVEDCLSQQAPDVMILSGVLQYLEDPYDRIADFSSKKIEYIILDCMPFNPGAGDRLTVQFVPPAIYNASYPCWMLDYNKVMDAFSKNYQLISEHENDLSIELDGRPVRYKGFFLKHK